MVIYVSDGGFSGLFFGLFFGPFSGPFSGHSPVYSLVYSLAYVLSKKQPDISVRPQRIFHHPITGGVLSFFNKFMESRNPPQSPVIPAPWPPYGLRHGFSHGFSQGVEETSRFSSPGISTLSSASKSPSPNSSAPPYPYLHPINAVSLAFAASLS